MKSKPGMLSPTHGAGKKPGVAESVGYGRTKRRMGTVRWLDALRGWKDVMRRSMKSLLHFCGILFLAAFFVLSPAYLFHADGTDHLALAEPLPGWEEQVVPYSEGEIAAISAVGEDIAWAIVEEEFPSTRPTRTFVLKTENGGSEWKPQELEVSMPALSGTDICAVDASTVWALKWGAAYRTLNGGEKWDLVSEISYCYAHEACLAQDLCALGTDTALCIVYKYFSGFDYHSPIVTNCIQRTQDGGSSWNRVLENPAHPVFYEDVSSLDVGDDASIWAGMLTMPPRVFHSTDGGATWEGHDVSGYCIHDLCALASSNVWAVATPDNTTPGAGTGHVLKTTDGGNTWEAHQGKAGVSLSAISVVDPLIAWAVGEVDTNYAHADKAVILKTTDGGATWSTQYECDGACLSCICAVDADTAWAGGRNPSGRPLILRTESGGDPEPLTLNSVYPDSAIQHTIGLNLTLEGTGFMPGSTVRLEKEGRVIEPLHTWVSSRRKIACTYSLFGVDSGTYDVVVANPDGDDTRLDGSFTVISPCGAGSGTGLLLLGLALGLLSLRKRAWP